MTYEFAVITSIEEGGGLAFGLDVFVVAEKGTEETDYRDKHVRVLDKYGPEVALALRVPVFTVGEILILDVDSGREAASPGRKPSKWFVTYETFSDVNAAVQRSRELETSPV